MIISKRLSAIFSVCVGSVGWQIRYPEIVSFFCSGVGDSICPECSTYVIIIHIYIYEGILRICVKIVRSSSNERERERYTKYVVHNF